MIKYIIHYQNDYRYAHLFQTNLIELIQKEVEITPLLNSDVLNYTFDYDEWTSSTSDLNKL